MFRNISMTQPALKTPGRPFAGARYCGEVATEATTTRLSMRNEDFSIGTAVLFMNSCEALIS
jgi:hypothetical protein